MGTEPRYDICVFGASAFDVSFLFSACSPYALAGRSRARLEAAAAAAGAPATTPILIADVADPPSLEAMARSTRLVINVVGPFRFYGEPVVAACVAAGTDYLDISGEPEFIERIEMEYAEKAKAAGCYVASAVGFDSAPGDVGALWTASQFRPPARCTLVETFITIKGGPSGFRGHFPTYESAVHGFAAAGELAALRKKAGKRPDLGIPGKRPKVDPTPQFEPRVGAWRLPFMGSDASVVRRTNLALAAARESAKTPPYNCAVYLTLPSRFSLYLFLAFGAVFSFLARRTWGRSLLLKYPRLFSFGLFPKEGPTAQQMAETSFSMTNLASGYAHGAPSPPDQPPDMRVVTRVAGPEPGYIACSIFVVTAAKTLLEERELLGVAPGVNTPAALLQNTTYVERLQQRGIVFEVL